MNQNYTVYQLKVCVSVCVCVCVCEGGVSRYEKSFYTAIGVLCKLYSA